MDIDIRGEMFKRGKSGDCAICGKSLQNVFPSKQVKLPTPYEQSKFTPVGICVSHPCPPDLVCAVVVKSMEDIVICHK